ncbi:hypothetical protein DLR69_15520 [Vibrio paracholerae]|uniref:Glycosyltransferase n=1 Tax=Vibrio paracholerae TaxID=650003 RepID=A0ABX9FEA1_9VIBR|nr:MULTISPECIES: hypothetical protein [Vibrio]MBY3673514.1 hypothetical protein [Vibrio cholerae]RBM51886.1 hypothetical protein DLR69_15520 [Vibrio paracholerae]
MKALRDGDVHAVSVGGTLFRCEVNKVKMKKIVFYYPSMNIGGAQLLFVRLANEISKLSGYSASVVDFLDGYIANNININVSHIIYENKSRPKVPADCIVVTPISNIINVYNKIELKENIKFIFWGIHPENTIDILRGARYLRKFGQFGETILKLINIRCYLSIRRAILLGLSKNSVVFMDSANRDRTFKFYNIHQTYNSFLPIPVPVESELQDGGAVSKRSVAWIGRLSSEKIHSLIYSMTELDKIGKFNFHIVGDGKYRHLLNSQCYKNLNIIYHGYIKNTGLSRLLLDNKIGLVFAMGTSVLESGMMALPSILVNPSYEPISPNYSPDWIYEAQDYTLGKFEYNSKDLSFRDMINDYLLDDKNLIGLKCRDYVLRNHSLCSVTSKLLAQASLAS